MQIDLAIEGGLERCLQNYQFPTMLLVGPLGIPTQEIVKQRII